LTVDHAYPVGELWIVFYFTVTMIVLLPLGTPSSDVIDVSDIDSTPLGV